MTDTLYYNISIDATSQQTSGITKGAGALPVNPNIVANNSQPIVANPQEWYGSIIRFSIPCFTVPLIQFLVQTPIITQADTLNGIYSFTLSYNGIYSDQIYYQFIPQIEDAPPPQYPSTTQDFSTYYYFLYSYGVWIDFQNTCLLTAFNNLKSKVGGALDTANPPYFYYDSATQLISLYADKAYFDNSLPTPVYIYFNTVCQQYFNGFIYNEKAVGSANGADCYFIVQNYQGNNLKTINSVEYIVMTQEFISLAYLSPLKNILITTNMNVNSEIFYLNSGTTNQNNNFLNVLTDFIPDLSGGNEAGIGSKIFIYNAPSLYRVFEFKSNTPLYSVSLGISWVDQLGNVYPLYLNKGTIATIKMMFVKKTVFNKFLL